MPLAAAPCGAEDGSRPKKVESHPNEIAPQIAPHPEGATLRNVRWPSCLLLLLLSCTAALAAAPAAGALTSWTAIWAAASPVVWPPPLLPYA